MVQTINMNINQNFKNRLWELQKGVNPRENKENEISNLSYSIGFKTNDLLINTLADSVPEKLDTLMDFILTSGTLNDRIIISPILISKDKLMDVNSNLQTIDEMTASLEPSLASQVNDFIQLETLTAEINYLSDSLKKNTISENSTWISTIAGDSTHFCQSYALNLIEQLNDTLYPRNVYIDNMINLKKQGYNQPYKPDNDCLLSLTPNPAIDILTIKLPANSFDNHYTIDITDMAGRKINSFILYSDEKYVNVRNWKSGKYFVILKVDNEPICTQTFIKN